MKFCGMVVVAKEPLRLLACWVQHAPLLMDGMLWHSRLSTPNVVVRLCVPLPSLTASLSETEAPFLRLTS